MSVAKRIMAPKLNYIDSHAHLFSEDYKYDLGEVITRAEEAGVQYIIFPATDLRTSRFSIELSEKYSLVYVCVGIHPHDTMKAADNDLNEIENLCNHKKVVAIGEIGLDYHYNISPKERQIDMFSEQMKIAVRKNLPVVVHTRKSFYDTLKVVRETIDNNASWIKNGKRGVFHCYSGSAEEALILKDLGFYISFTGSITFKNSESISVIKKTGIENVLLETDSPYMTPVPLRGKRNEPANIVLVCKKISEILDISEEKIAMTTTMNSTALFGLKKV
jgi:TatD DNase family protein